MKIVSRLLVAVVLLSLGCGSVPPTPTGPTLVQPTFPTTTSPPPNSPPFTLALDGAPTAQPGRWPFTVTLATPRGVIPLEAPDTLRIACGGTVVTQRAGFGTTSGGCDFPTAGVFGIDVLATGSAGFTSSRSMAVTVSWPPPRTVDVFYSVVITDARGSDVAFSVAAVSGTDRYHWDFGDGGVDTTLLPQVFHRFTKPSTGSNERVVTMTATAGDGRTLATGRVVGRW